MDGVGSEDTIPLGTGGCVVDALSMITNENSPDRWIEMVAGIRRRTVASGKTMMQMLVQLDAGSHLPEHQHPNEQVTHVLRGTLRLVVGGNPAELGVGESLYIASNIPHSADALDDVLVIDTFSPPREDLLVQDHR